MLCEKIFSCCPAELADLSFVDTEVAALAGAAASRRNSAERARNKAATDAETGGPRIAVHLDRSASCVAEVRTRVRLPREARAHVRWGSTATPPSSTARRGRRSVRALPLVQGGDSDYTTLKSLAAGAPRPRSGCAEGMRCDPDAKVCKALVQKNDACTYDDDVP